MGVLSDTGDRSFPTGLRVRWRSGWSGEERDGAEGGEEGEEIHITIHEVSGGCFTHAVPELPCLSDDCGVEQGLTDGEEELMGDTPATRLRGGPGEEVGEGLDRELRHLETEEKKRGHLQQNVSSF